MSVPVSLPIKWCEICRGTGRYENKTCHQCAGYGAGYLAHDKFLFWQWPLNQLAISERRFRRTAERWVRWGGIVIMLGLGGLFFWQATINNALAQFFSLRFWMGDAAGVSWWGAIGLVAVFLFAYSVRQRAVTTAVAAHPFSVTAAPPSAPEWTAVRALPKVARQNIATAFTTEAQQVLERAYLLATAAQAPEVNNLFIFQALLENTRVQNLFLRALVLPKEVGARLPSLLPKTPVAAAPLMAPAAWQTIFQSYEEAWNARLPVVDVTELLLMAVEAEPKLTELLFEFGLQGDMLRHIVGWVRIREELQRQRARRVAGSLGRGKGDTNRTMTAVATPYLNSYSQDLTRAAFFGLLTPLVGRQGELEEVFRLVQGGGMSVVLVGNPGVGRQTIIQGIAQLMVAENVPEILRDKRLVELDIPRFMAGADAAEAEERLLNMLYELQMAGNVILAIPSIERMVGNTGAAGLDVAGVLATELGKRGFLTIATTTPAAYQRFITGQALGNVFQKVVVEEMDTSAAIEVLEAKIGYIEYQHSVWFTYQSLARAVELAQRYLPDKFLPAKAVDICQEVAQHVVSSKGKNTVVTEQDVAAIISEKTKIPVTAVTEDEGEKLLRLENALHQRVVGQEEAVSLVANALRRARAEIRSGKRPIANFLFLGPTGVGKTELAKTIAEVYFGAEKQMVRLDMSEYQDTTAIYRLLGRPGEQGTGVLTEAVRQTPFAIVLLDEIEKAAPNILDLFLQVMDDGRLTDSVGRVIDFTNTIIVMTSNAGTAFVQEKIRSGVATEQIKNQLLHGQLTGQFRPEFLNRFDAIVLFQPLTEAQIGQVAQLILRGMAKKLEERGMFLRVTAAAVADLAHAGYDPEFGARPLRRVIQDRVENTIAGLLLQNQVKRKDTIVVDVGGVTIEPGK